MPEGNGSGYGSTPVPDPTKLTTDAVNAATDIIRREQAGIQAFLEERIDGLSRLLDERYATQTKALDAAFVAAEKAVKAALDSSDKAVAKAEVATEKRFESVDKFRAQLADQAVNFMTRTEAGVRIDSMSEKLDFEVARTSERLRELELRVTSRLDLSEGAKKGVSAAMATALAVGGLLVAIVVAAVTIMATR